MSGFFQFPTTFAAPGTAQPVVHCHPSAYRNSMSSPETALRA